MQFFGGVLDGFDDVLVARATAQVAAHAVANFVFAGVGVFVQKAVGAHQHARGAKAALQTVLFVKAFLHRMQHTFVGQAFDGEDFGAVALNGQMCAGFNRLAVDVYRTNTAVTGFTANVRASEVEFFAQKVDQQCARLNRFFFFLAVDGDGDEFFGHGVFLEFKRTAPRLY